MGLAAFVAGTLIALAIVVAMVYGAFVGLVRFGRLLWRFLVEEGRSLNHPSSEG